MKFNFIPCADIEGLYIVEPKVVTDERGYTMATYKARDFREAGITVDFVDDLQSKSRRGVIRGLHFQKIHQQAKLARVISGEVYDVAVDIRAGSKTFGEWFGVVLSAEKKNMLYIPAGFAHGYLVLSEEAEFAYKLGDHYYPEDEGGLMWDDKALGIDWPLPDGVSVSTSEKDKNWPAFSDEVALEPRSK